jgi:hypothetical protein
MTYPTAERLGIRLVHSVERSDADLALDGVAQTFIDWLEVQYPLNKRFDDTATVQVIDLPEDHVLDRAVSMMEGKGWSIDVAHHKSAGCNAGAVTLCPPRRS